MKVKLTDILPNPYRDLVRNPLVETKITKLQGSIERTGFWDNVVIRKNSQGKWEAGYGHHRIEAARRCGITEADFIVKELTDADMLKMLSDENADEYGYSILSLLETVRGVVNALAEGNIPAFEISKDTRKDTIRYAPSYHAGVLPADELSARPYTTLAIAKFLGKKGDTNDADVSVRAAINALELIEKKVFTEESIKNMKVDQLLKMTRDLKARAEERKLNTMADQKEAAKLREQSLALEKKRKDEEANHKAAKELLLKQQADAQREEDDRKAAEAIAEIKRNDERQKLRDEASKKSRAVLDDQIKANNERMETARKMDANQATTYKVNAVLGKLSTIISERFSFREEIKALARDEHITTNQRELVRKAMLQAGTWYNEESNKFLPPLKTDVLAEARSKEEAKRRSSTPEDTE